MQAESNTLALSKGKFLAAAAALLIGGLLLANGAPRAAAAFEPGASLQLPSGRMHDGVDWSRVAAAPVDTGATVGAYDR